MCVLHFHAVLPCNQPRLLYGHKKLTNSSATAERPSDVKLTATILHQWTVE